MNTQTRKFAVVTGASTGIGLELARLCAKQKYDLVIAADEPLIEAAAKELEEQGVECTAVECDLSDKQGVDVLLGIVQRQGRPVDVLIANAGHGLGHAFLDQDIDEALNVVHTNVDGTIYLVHSLGREMRDRHEGRILITGSIAGLMPGTFQAVYNGSKAFIDSFSVALSNELKDSGVTVTCLMPGATETNFFERAGLADTKVGAGEKANAADVAKAGFDAMMKGEIKVVAGFANKVRAAMTNVLPDTTLAEMHRGTAEPGSATNPNKTPDSKRKRRDYPQP